MTTELFGLRADLVIPLLAGHLLGDFVLQSRWMVTDKNEKLGVLLVHAAIVALVSWTLTGYLTAWFWLLPIALGTHCAIDWSKARLAGLNRSRSARSADARKRQNGDLVLFFLDQAAHLCVIALIAWAAEAFPWALRTVSGEAVWRAAFGDLFYAFLVVLSGWIAGAIAAGYVLGLHLQRFEDQLSVGQKGGLENGGFWIGVTERSLIYLFMLVGNPAGIGFLAAAKSVFRIGELRESADRNLAEYILIGTLMSFTVAMAIGLATRLALDALP